AVGVIQQHAQVADAPYAGFRTHRRLARFDARVAERALLGFAALPVGVHLFIGAARNAHAPAAAFVLIDQHDAVVFALVDRTRRATGHACRVQTMFTQARQVHHERVFEGGVHLFLHTFELRVTADRSELAALVVFPVGAQFVLVHVAPRKRGDGARGGRRL